MVFNKEDTPILLPGVGGRAVRRLELHQIQRPEQRTAGPGGGAAQDSLVVYLAHDLKTPLTSVIGYVVLQEAPDMPASQRAKYTGIALEKAYRLERLIN